MRHYTIPHTDLNVSRLAYGSWHLGGSWDKEPLTLALKVRAQALLETAVEQGINHIDLADIYTMGKSDSAVGHVLAQNPGLRDRLILQEKCGIILAGDPEFGPPGRYDFSYQHIVSSVERSLRRLGTDRLDILALHRPDPLLEPEEVARAFDHLQQSGKVRYFGVSNHTAGQIALLQRYLDQKLVLNQLELNLLHHSLISDGILANSADAAYLGSTGLLDYCRLHEIMIQAWSPVAGGRLFRPVAETEKEQALAEAISIVAETHETTVEAVALAWLLRHPAGIQPIVGTLKPERIGQSTLADQIELSRVEWYQLLTTALGKPVP